MLVASPSKSWPVRLISGQALTLGAQADVCVEDPSLLPTHLVITAADDGTAQVEARGPALLNGVQLSANAQVRPGDEVTVGATTLVFHAHSEPAAPIERVFPWEPFQWLVAEELARGVTGSLTLSRTRLSGRGRHGAFDDKLYALFGVDGVSATEVRDPFDLFEGALARMLGLPRDLEGDEQLTQDAVMLRLLSVAERLAEARASVLVVGEAGTGKWSFAKRIAPDAHVWEGQSVAPAGALAVRRAELLDASAMDQLAAAVRAGRQVVATAVRPGEALRSLFAHVITHPSLRDRPVDIEPLAELFLTRARRALGLRAPSLSGPVRTALLRGAYPRNVSELKWVMEVAAVVTDAEEVLLDALPERLREGASDNLRVSMKQAEKDALLHALGKTRWNVSATARLLGLPRRTVVYRMAKLGLRRPARASS